MADADTSVRRRKPESKTTIPNVEPVDSESDSGKELERQKTRQSRRKKTTPKTQLDDDDAYTTANLALDIVRVLTFIFLASCGLSYLISNGETFFWGMSNPPKYMKLDWWKKQITGPIYLTPSELALHDGSNTTLPIYLAINGTIFDVSANARTYGPGGSYQYFAGADASRGFVTGCFAEDRTADMRGVEDMFLPLDDPAVDAHWSAAELEAMKKTERDEAARKVHEGLKHWVDFFKNHGKYEFVGHVRQPAGWPETEPRRELCEPAAKGRKVRVVVEKGE
ncbi:cytochrome b5 [Trichocladium antarcticum]|uniref:Cytochrome b5 n=1 Tax=Trichocladium antarcticum TaxID=1450529 RepID=A0AAN6ZFN3_9PEZI|nr:cytochrome b5 [Trichocladium antarcticum]